MKKVLLLCAAFLLSACTQKAEIKKGDALESQSKSCSVNILVKEGQRIVDQRVEKCEGDFVVKLTAPQGNGVSFEYRGIIKNSDGPNKVFMSLMMSHNKIEERAFNYEYGVLNLPTVKTRSVMQKAVLVPGKVFSQKFESLDISIAIKK